ncbi:MAG: DUF3526 domain-containing protein [Tenacibaculum sp.]|nr:DUF3526 domain-containing protein [Tenacibaculum sp.]
MIKNIFLHDFKILYRNKIFVILLIVMGTFIFSSLKFGQIRYNKILKNISDIELLEKKDFQTFQKDLQKIEKNNGFFNGPKWQNPTNIYTVAREMGSGFAVKKPSPLQILNVGQSDLLPYYYKVSPNKKQALIHESEINNGVLQFLGNFDLFFVTIYLLPLIIIALSFNILSSEKEQGTLKVINISNIKLSKFIFYKLFLRLSIFTGTYWLIVVLFLTTISVEIILSINFLWIFILVNLYFLLWFSLSFLINSFFKSSNYNVSFLVTLWLVTMLLVPSVIQVVTEKLYPMPSRVTLINEKRNALEIIEKEVVKTLEKFIYDHPELSKNSKEISVREYNISKFEKIKKIDNMINPLEKKLEKQLEKQQNIISNFMYLSPALLLQEQANYITGTHTLQYKKFDSNVNNFREILKDFYINISYSKTTFDHELSNKIPRFNTNTNFNNYSNRTLISSVLLLLIMTILMFVIGVKKLNNN